MDGARGDGRGDAASDEARDRFRAEARPGGEAASVEDHDDLDFDRVSVVSGASEWSDSASVRSGYTGLSGVSNLDHRYADAEAVVRREAVEAAAKAAFSERQERPRLGAFDERDDDGASDFFSDASDPSTSDGESRFAARLRDARAFPRKNKSRSLAMRLGEKRLGQSHALRSATKSAYRDVDDDDDDALPSPTRPPRDVSARGVHGRLTLVEAVKTGDFDLVKRVIASAKGTRHGEKNFDVDALDDGRGALHAAVELGDARGLEILKFLVEELGADVEKRGALGIAPLHVASYCGSVACVRFLLLKGARVNVVDDDGSAATHWAASSGKSLCASVLLQTDDVDVDIVNDKGLAAHDLIDPADVATLAAFEMANKSFQPHALAADGRLAILRRALANTFDVAVLDPASPRAVNLRRRFGDDANNSSSGRPPPHDDDDTKKVDTIVKEKEKPARRIKRTKIAIDERAPDSSGETMAMRAARFGRAETLRALVSEFGADLDARCFRIGATATHFAAENGHVDVLRVVRDASGFPRSRKRRAEARTAKPAFRALPQEPKGSSFAEYGETPDGDEILPKSTRRRERVKTQTAPRGSTPLHFAARNGHAETCAFLVEDMHCDVNAADGDGQTAAHVAAARGRLETLRRLRRLGANLDARDVDGRTPLHVFACATTRALSSSDASSDVSSEMVAFFLDPPETDASVRAARLNARDGRGDAPAHVAFASGGSAETAFALLPNVFFANTPNTPNTRGERDAFRGCGGWTCLHFAARGGHLELVDRLTRLESTDVAAADDAGATALHVAAETGVVAVLESLLAAAAERDASLSLVSTERSETNANANANDDVRLVGASALARRRTNAGKTALHVACRAGNAASARVLLALCPDSLDARDASGAAPCHCAAARADRGGATCVALLCRAGCVLAGNTTLEDGADPLHVASSRGAFLAVKELVNEAERRGVLAAVVNRRTAFGLTPAACAARAGAVDVFAFLLKKGADPFVPDARGNTCAHHACCRRARGAYYGGDADETSADDTPADASDAARARNARDVFALTLRHAVNRARADYRLKTMTSPGRSSATRFDIVDDDASRAEEHVAAGLEQLRVVRAVNGDGETPAHVAARSGWACLLRFLLDRGAELSAEDARGRDVLQAACERDRPAAVALILAYVEEHGEEAEIFDQGFPTLSKGKPDGKRRQSPRLWSDGITPASVRWRALRRGLPDVVSSARAGVAFDARRVDVEDALETAWFKRLGVFELWSRGDANDDDDASGTHPNEETLDAQKSERRFSGASGLDAFARVDAALRRADELFKKTRRERFVNRRSRVTGDAPLHVAASMAHARTVAVLINAGADVNLRDEGDAGDAPLHRAARAAKATSNKEKAIDAARALLLRGADQRAKNATWVTPLHQAVRLGDTGLVRLFLQFAERAETLRPMFGPNSNREHAKGRGSAYELVNRASRSGATPLHSAAELGNVEIFDALIAFGAEVNARTIRNESVAHVAARLGHDVVLTRLLEFRDEARRLAEASSTETTFGDGSFGDDSVTDAVTRGSQKQSVDDSDDFLVARDHTESFPIHWAAAGGHSLCVSALVRFGSPVRIGGMWRGATPAHLAARAGAAETLTVLIRLGADVNAQDFWTLATPLHYAAEAGQKKTVRVLMENKARLDSPDAAGVVPERAARDAELGRTIRAFRIIGTVGRRLSGIKLPHVFYGWRETTHERRSAKARDAKGTWQLVFALFAEKNARNDDDAKNDDANDDDDDAEEKDAFVSKYYWLWRQWETRRRRRRRALGLGPSDAECTRLVADALESNPATAGLRHAALAWLAEASTTGRVLARSRAAASEGFEERLFETYARGDVVWREGTATDGTMCVVLKGRFDVFMTHEDTNGFAFESAVASLKPGATFGETAMRFDGHRPTTVRARVGGSRVLRVFKSDFERAWEMEREAVERETRDARARRAAARRRRRAERRARRFRRRQKRTLSATVSSTPHSDAYVCSSGSESELDSEDDLARTTVDPNDLKSFTLETSRDPPTRVAPSELSSELSKKRDVSNRTADTVKKRSLLPWEREFLASLLTTVTYDPGDALPVAPQCDDETTGDPLRDATEDAYFGFVLAGELIVSSSRGVGVEKKKKVDVITAGQTFYSLAARETRDGRVARYGVETVRVSAAKDAEPAKVALLQGMDVLELPKSLRDLLFRRAVVHARWRPPPRHAPRSTAEPDSESEASEEEEEEEEGGGVLTTVPDVRSPPSSSGGSHVDLAIDAPAWDDRGLFREFVEELVEAFKHVDTDRGGDIDENELKFAARSLGFEPNPRRLRAMLDAMDEDGGGSVDLGEFINVVSKRIVDAVDPDALDAAFDAFDEKRTGRITFDDIQKVARRVGDFVASDELEALMNLGAADLDGDGCIDRAEFGEIMRVRETDTASRRAALRREIKRQKDASEDAAVVVEMLGEYDVERDSAHRSRVFEEKEKNAKGGVAGAALAAAAKARRDEERKKKETPLRATLRAVFDGVARLGVSSKTDDEDGNRRDASEIDVRDLIRALRLDAEGDGSLARALHLPQRLTLRRDDGTAERFEVMFREMDADGSGSVDFEEFFNYFRRLKKERAAEVVARAVVRFDEIGARDGDDDDDDGDDDENKETTRDNLGVVGLSNGLAASFRAKIAARRAANERGAREENDGLVAAGALGRTT